MPGSYTFYIPLDPVGGGGGVEVQTKCMQDCCPLSQPEMDIAKSLASSLVFVIKYAPRDIGAMFT